MSLWLMSQVTYWKMRETHPQITFYLTIHCDYLHPFIEYIDTLCQHSGSVSSTNYAEDCRIQSEHLPNILPMWKSLILIGSWPRQKCHYSKNYLLYSYLKKKKNICKQYGFKTLISASVAELRLSKLNEWITLNSWPPGDAWSSHNLWTVQVNYKKYVDLMVEKHASVNADGFL